MEAASWTLGELVVEAVAALARVPAPDNGQIRAVPDERSLRYYTSIGLLERPAAMRGRTALYGRRHLAQVVAIKRMQTAGKSLAEIQQILASIDDATLARLSGVSLPKSTAPRAARAEFWRRPPADPAASAPEPEAQGSPDSDLPPPPHVSITLTHSLRFALAPGIDLVVDAIPGAAVDPAAIAAAAQPLLAELARQGISAFRPEPPDGGYR